VGPRAAVPRVLRRRLAVGARVLSALEDARARLVARFGGAVVDPWWAGLPRRLDRLATAWAIEVDAPVGSGNTSLVLWCRAADGAAAVLKLSPDPALAVAEANALRAWAASGRVPAVRAFDAEAGALLLERIADGTPVARRAAAPGIEAVAALVGGLHSVGAPAGLPPLAERVAWMFSHRFERGVPFVDALRRGGRAAVALAAEPAPVVLLHGDLHPGNVLDGGPDRGLVAIDPRPCVGDPAFDAVDWVFHRAGPDDWAARTRALAAALGCDPARLWRWCGAFAPMIAGSGETPAEHVDALLAMAAATARTSGR
jgi:streptomycin 6-kinase